MLHTPPPPHPDACRLRDLRHAAPSTQLLDALVRALGPPLEMNRAGARVMFSVAYDQRPVGVGPRKCGAWTLSIQANCTLDLTEGWRGGGQKGGSNGE
eukprot:152746-Chlamydomonas_euryale.AAC.1